MKNTLLFPVLILAVLILQSCIGKDVIDDRVDPALRILNPADTIEAGTDYQFELLFTNEVGQQEDIDIAWLSKDPSFAQVDDSGLLTAITEGTTTISAVAIDRGAELSFEIIIGASTVVTEIERRVGVIETTSFYTLEGDFEIFQEDNNLRIEIAENYRASSSLPGLYLYLTNNPSTINGALEVAAIDTFSGAHSFVVENQDINTYNYLLYFCKPFNVKVGDGLIN